ncbi:Negative elongation factor C/D [Entophlyctis luteolus]|nr:Negative elongation factor C/D [Entophlyctis luteolus]
MTGEILDYYAPQPQTFLDELVRRMAASAASANETTASSKGKALQDVVALGCESETALVLALALLKRASDTTTVPDNSQDIQQQHLQDSRAARAAARVTFALEAAAGQKGKPFAAAAAFPGRALSADLVLAAAKICDKDVQASNVFKLHQIYSGPNPPTVEYIRKSQFVGKSIRRISFMLTFAIPEALIKNVFGAEETDSSMMDEKIWLLAYVSCVIETPVSAAEAASAFTVDKSLLDPTTKALKYLRSVFPKLTPDIDLRNEFANLLDCVRYLSNPVFYESNSMIAPTTAPSATIVGAPIVTADPILIFELLDEIAFIYPLQRAYVMEILGECIVRGYDRLSPLIALEVRKKFVEKILVLLKLGFAIPVLLFMNENASRMDDSVIVYFLKRFYDISMPPYESEIMKLVVSLIAGVHAENMSLSREAIMKLLADFLSGMEGVAVGDDDEEQQREDHVLKRKVISEIERLTL